MPSSRQALNPKRYLTTIGDEDFLNISADPLYSMMNSG